MKNSKLALSLAAFAAVLVLNSAAQTAAAAASTTPADPLDPGTVRSSIDLIRADLKVEKAYIIAQNVAFTNDESDEFWPLYNDYNAAQNVLLDERLALIKEYLDQHETLNDQQAQNLMSRVLELEGKRLDLKRTWFRKFSEAVPATKAAKFFQVENQINAALDLKLMDSMPLIK
jgi:hypothetical protein